MGNTEARPTLDSSTRSLDSSRSSRPVQPAGCCPCSSLEKASKEVLSHQPHLTSSSETSQLSSRSQSSCSSASCASTRSQLAPVTPAPAPALSGRFRELVGRVKQAEDAKSARSEAEPLSARSAFSVQTCGSVFQGAQSGRCLCQILLLAMPMRQRPSRCRSSIIQADSRCYTLNIYIYIISYIYI